jgi:hypothetical protein
VAGDTGDISDMRFDTIGTQIKKILLKYLQERVSKNSKNDIGVSFTLSPAQRSPQQIQRPKPPAIITAARQQLLSNEQ